MSESKDILLEFSGWAEVSPDAIHFRYLGWDDSVPEYIDGVEWQDLPEEVQEDYIVDNVYSVMNDAYVGVWESLSTEVINNE